MLIDEVKKIYEYANPINTDEVKKAYNSIIKFIKERASYGEEWVLFHGFSEFYSPNLCKVSHCGSLKIKNSIIEKLKSDGFFVQYDKDSEEIFVCGWSK